MQQVQGIPCSEVRAFGRGGPFALLLVGALLGAPGGLEAQQLDETWTLTVNGQAAQVNPDGTFEIPNVSAADEYGAGGPGTAPDFLSDEFLRLTGVSTVNGVATYVFSEFFQIAQNQAYAVFPLTFTGDPPPLPVSLSMALESSSLAVDEGTRALVYAALADGSVVDVSLSTEWTAYKTSNPNVATVDSDGNVMGIGGGEAFITAINGGATAVRKLVVSPAASLTTVVGFVEYEDGSPAVGAEVRVAGQLAMASVGSDGGFQLANVIVDGAPISVIATVSTPEGTFSGASGDLQGVPGEFTDAGIITVIMADSSGRDFAFCFPRNFIETPTLTVFIAGDTATTGEVRVPGIGFKEAFAVSPGNVTAVTLPATAQSTQSDGVDARAVLVSAENDVCVYGLSRIAFTTDAFAALPVDTFGQRYRIVSHAALGSSQNATGFAVVATENATTVTVTPKTAVDGHPGSVPYDIELDADQVYQFLSASGDATGTLVQSDKPVGVLGAHSCAQIPVGFNFCDHLIEMLAPVSTWGDEVLTVNLAQRLNGDFFRIVADTDGTTVEVAGVVPASFTLDAGEFAELNLGGTNQITASAPILVAQYATGSTFGGNPGDPFMMTLPPADQYQNSYVFSTPASGFSVNYVNVVAPTSVAASGGVLLDGTPIQAGLFVPIASTPFQGAQVSIALGSHDIASEFPIGIFVYGFNNDDSYGYPGGMALNVK
ncbi:IgGFc-binding protein [Engelhardtia mirabilis]